MAKNNGHLVTSVNSS